MAGFSGRQDSAAQRGALGLAALWEEGKNVARLAPLGMVWHQVCQAGRSIATSPMTSFLTVVTIAVSMCLLTCFMLLLENAGFYLQTTRREVGVSLYLSQPVSASARQELEADLARMPQVEKVDYRSKEEALADFRRLLGQQAGLLDALEGVNPLPASLEVKLKDGSQDAFNALADRFISHPLVEEVHYDRGIVGQLGMLMETLKAVGVIAAALVLVMTAFIIASTIKLALYSHREEIEIMRLVGATDPFVRAPYVIEGCLQGTAGSLAGIVVVYGLFALLSDYVQASPVFRLILPSLTFLSWSSIMLIVVLGIAVGIGGSYFTLRRFYLD